MGLKFQKSLPPQSISCPVCKGRGELIGSHRMECYQCDGNGYVEEKISDFWLEISRRVNQFNQTMDCVRHTLRKIIVDEGREVPEFVSTAPLQQTEVSHD